MTLNFVEENFTIGQKNPDIKPTFTFFKKGFRIGSGKVSPDWREVTLSGVGALSLINAKKDGLTALALYGACEYVPKSYVDSAILYGGTELLPETYLDTVTLSGKCEQSGTPTPSQPIDIISNNGAIKVSPNLLNMNDIYGNYLLTDGGQVGNEAQNFVLTNFIRVFPNTTYTFSFISGADAQYRRVCGYSSADQTTFTQLLIKKARPTTVDAQYDLVFTTDANTNYIRISTNTLDTNTQVAQGSTAPTYRPYGQIYTDGTTETVTDNVGNVATCQMLLRIENSIDKQEILSGAVTRDIDITVLDGSEAFAKITSRNVYSSSAICPNITRSKSTMYCTHFVYDSGSSSEIPDGAIATANTSTNVFMYNGSCTSVAQFQQWLKDQYTAGTPVIIVYQRQTETTETVTGQVLQKSPVSITQASLTGLTITTTESSHTVPTPTQPLDINCNNGVVKVSKNLFNYEYFYDNYQTYTGSSVGRCPIKLQPNTQYTVSTNTQTSSTSSKIFVVSGSAINWTPVSADNGVLVNSPRTVTTDSNGYLCLGIYVSGNNEIPESDFINGTVLVQIEQGSTATSYTPYAPNGIYVDGTTETVEIDTTGDTATAQPLYKVGTYQDVQSVITGEVTRKVGIKVLDGTENWTEVSGSSAPFALVVDDFESMNMGTSILVYSTHFQGVPASATWSNYNSIISFTGSQGSEVKTFRVRYLANTKTLAEFKQFLAEQYANGTPVICVYCKTATTETVTPQELTVQDGTNQLVITQASMTGLTTDFAYSVHTQPSATQPLQIRCNNGILSANAKNQIVVTGTTETVEIDTTGDTATAENLYKVGDYQDVHSVLDGIVTRNCNVVLYDGTQTINTPYMSTTGGLNTGAIIVYPLATPTTETVTPQSLSIQEGTNTIEITQASIDNLSLEASYKRTI